MRAAPRFFTPPAPPLPWRTVWGIWTVVGVLLVIQTYLIVGGNPGASLRGHLYTSFAQMLRAWIWAALTPVVFWLRRYLAAQHPQVAVRFALHLLAALTFFAVGNLIRLWTLYLVFGYFRPEDKSPSFVLAQLDARSLIDLYLYALLVAVGYISDLMAQRRDDERREEGLRAQLAQAELAALRQQIQPHFLFNAHNAVAALIRERENDKAIDAITQLSALLRQLMEHAGKPEIELWRELDYAQAYLAIEKLRLEERLVTHFLIDDDCLDARVPTLILQPIVENAVRHGIAQRRNPGTLTVTARRDGDRLAIEVVNDASEFAESTARGRGVGLGSTRARLERIFGRSLRFAIAFNQDGVSRVRIEFPFRAASAAAPSLHA
ncbi:MAG: histidine kinase [Candidatus Didemnitutus sp.]|nr:histidine kinase [Candidatus Didemnitutus sp.]